MSLTKIGPHVLKPTKPALAYAGAAPIVKAVNDPKPLTVARDDAIRVWRVTHEPQTPTERADDVAARIIGGLKGYRHPLLYCEVSNEIPGGQTASYLSLWRDVTNLLHRSGVKVALPSWATGDFEPAAWMAIRDADWCGADAIALHAYWSTEGLTPWNALRWTRRWRPGDPPVLITECGRDRVRDGSPLVNQGYLPLGGQPYGWQAKSQNVTAEQYILELEAFDAILADHPEVLGATVFTFGATDDWRDRGFDTDSLVPELVARTLHKPILGTPTPKGPDVPVLGAWRVTPGPPAIPSTPTEVRPMPDITLTVPTKVRLTNNHGGPRSETRGVFIHSTRGGVNRTLQKEYDGTVGYFLTSGTQASSHFVVGPGEVTRMVHDDDTAWHARSANATWLSIEIVQPLTTTPYTPWQLDAAAEIVAKWSAKYAFPLVRVHSETYKGIIGHEDSAVGKQDGKSDPGPLFPWGDFLSRVGRFAAPAPTPNKAPAQVWKPAALEADGWGPAWRAKDFLRSAGSTVAADAIEAAIIADKKRFGL